MRTCCVPTWDLPHESCIGQKWATVGNLNKSGMAFYGQDGTMDGRNRRLVFGDLTLTTDEDGTVTGSFNSRIAW